MKNHANSCHWFSDTHFGSEREDVLARQAQMKDKENMNPSASPVSNWNVVTSFTPHGQASPAARPLKRTRTATNVSYGDAPAYDNDIQKEFHDDICKLLVANGWAWRSANNPETRLFMNKWTGGGLVPDRKVLSGSVLNNQVAEVEERVKAKIQGKVGIAQCDGWKNNAKKSVVSTMVMVENEVRTFRCHLSLPRCCIMWRRRTMHA
jgi:hypothetical protein